MSPQIMLRRHASSAAALLERKETAPTFRNDGGQHSVKKRPPPARPPLPARLRSISHQPLPGQFSEFKGALRDIKPRPNSDRHQIYVSSTSRICFATSLDGLVGATKLQGCRPPATLPCQIQTMRNVIEEDERVETQAVACWLEGSSSSLFVSFCGSSSNSAVTISWYYHTFPSSGLFLFLFTMSWLWREKKKVVLFEHRESDKWLSFIYLLYIRHLYFLCVNPGESDGDDLADDHHYEALYEVINPRLQSIGAAASATLLDHQDDSFDDSFDSDDAFEEVIVRGLVIFWKKKREDI